jgi:hypothetical protein
MFKLTTGHCCSHGSTGKVAKTRKKGSPSGNHLGSLGLFTVDIFGPFLYSFSTSFLAHFVYLAEEQTKGNRKWN